MMKISKDSGRIKISKSLLSEYTDLQHELDALQDELSRLREN